MKWNKNRHCSIRTNPTVMSVIPFLIFEYCNKTGKLFVIPKHKIIHYFLKKKDALQISFWPLVNELLMHHSIFNCRWRFFVHGCVDSYSRKIMYLSCSGNNKAETVLAHFFTSGCCSWASLKDKRWPWC